MKPYCFSFLMSKQVKMNVICVHFFQHISTYFLISSVRGYVRKKGKKKNPKRLENGCGNDKRRIKKQMNPMELFTVHSQCKIQKKKN